MTYLKSIMIFSKLALILIVFSIGLLSCGGEDNTYEGWKYVGELRDEKGQKVKVYMDTNNFTVEGNIRKFWIRYYTKTDVSENTEYIRQIGYWEVDCQDRTLFRLGEEYYGPDSELLGREEKRVKEDYKEGSLGQKLASAACRFGGGS